MFEKQNEQHQVALRREQAITDPNDDSNGDGRSDLLECFAETDPFTDSSNEVPPLVFERFADSRQGLNFWGTLDRDGRQLKVTVQQSEDFFKWSEIVGFEEVSSMRDSGTGRLIAGLEPAGCEKDLFYRVKVEFW